MANQRIRAVDRDSDQEGGIKTGKKHGNPKGEPANKANAVTTTKTATLAGSFIFGFGFCFSLPSPICKQQHQRQQQVLLPHLHSFHQFNTMCNDLGEGSRCCAFYSAIGTLFTVSLLHSIRCIDPSGRSIDCRSGLGKITHTQTQTANTSETGCHCARDTIKRAIWIALATAGFTTMSITNERQQQG